MNNDSSKLGNDEYVPLPKKFPYWSKILLALVLIIGLIGFWNLLHTESITDIVEEQLKAISENKITEAYYSYTSQEFQKETTLNSFRDFIKSHPVFSNYSAFDFQKNMIDNDNALIEGTLIGKDHSVLAVEYKLIKEEGDWKILSITLPKQIQSQQISSPPVSIIEEKKDELIISQSRDAIEAILYPAVENHLKLLAKQDKLSAYKHTSKKFQESTSYEDFSHLISELPMFSEQDNVKFKKRKIENGAGKVEVELKDSQDRSTTAEYTLGRESDSWKIWGIRIMDIPEKELNDLRSMLDTESINEIVQNELKLLREHNFRRAYYDFTSKEFREIIAFDDFVHFIKSYPYLMEHVDFHFNTINVENDLVTLGGFLVSNNQIFPIEFDLLEEDKSWKIYNIELAQPQIIKNFTNANMELEKVVIGNLIDSKGIVLNPSLILNPTIHNLFVNVYLSHVIPDSIVRLSVENLENSANTASLATKLQQAGDAVVTYTLKPPKDGWTKGHYQMHVSTSHGHYITSFFKID